MTFSRRAFLGEVDLQAMAALARGSFADNMHVVDLPYRFSSWAMDDSENIGLWVDGKGELIGWAVMQTPFWTIDYVCHALAPANLHQQILAWADQRAQKIVDTPVGRPIWFINVFTTQQDRIRDLEEAGFASQADVGENSWTKVLMQRTEQASLPDYRLPEGFVIRPLAGVQEVEAYVDLHRAVFESKSMTIEWRQRTLNRPQYTADLDLVAVAPDGRLAAFCIGWLAKGTGVEPGGQIEPLGVHADYRRLGLGRSILTEGLRRLHAYGARSIYVETDNYRDEAFLLYESAGFRVAHDVLVFRKEYTDR